MYVHDHLAAGGSDIDHLRTYLCPQFHEPDMNRITARRRLLDGKTDIVCGNCEYRIPLWDDIEQQLANPDIRARVEGMRRAAQVVLDNESRERLLVGEVYAMAARANQIGRELTVSDHGIDMEIEFKDNEGHATGTKLYLQLKSGDSHLRTTARDHRRVFPIKKARHADYWANQQFPVMLIIRSSDGDIEWMEIGEHLRSERSAGNWPARAIDFTGERFDVMSIRAWRTRTLNVT